MAVKVLGDGTTACVVTLTSFTVSQSNTAVKVLAASIGVAGVPAAIKTGESFSPQGEHALRPAHCGACPLTCADCSDAEEQ